jgi:hypothetical protein
MKFADLKVNTEYAVIPSWDYSSSDKKNPDTVERRHVIKSELVSLDKYEYKVYRGQKPDDSNFVLAPKGSRAVGYLVRSGEWATQGTPEVYWLARPQDIVAEYASLESRWTTKEAEEKRKAQEELDKRREEERKEREAYEVQNRISNSCLEALRTIIGDRVNLIEADVSKRRNQVGEYFPVARFTLDGKTMQFLIEKVLEARDMVA